jgi:multiple antibiotic resistance protein
MMRGKQSETRATQEEKVEAEAKQDIAIIPMGLPLLSGPGAIATVMVLVGKATSWPQRFGVYAAIVAVSSLVFVVLHSAAFVARVLGRTGINLIGRIMGLILAATAIQFVIDGVHEAFPKLAL